jgi:hypothetical protein
MAKNKPATSSDAPVIDAEIVAERTSAALALRPPDSLSVQRSPNKVIEEAMVAAKVLQDIIEKKPDKIVFNKKTYLTFEDWQTLGRFWGYTVKEDGDPEPVTLGEAQGFKASSVGLDSQGVIRSRATAFCMNDEEKWSSRPKYAYVYVLKGGGTSIDDPGKDKIIWEDNPNKAGGKRPKKERQLIGQEKVPMFQLASMAQTRSGAKALRNILSWVAVLAGYAPTPVEEMDGQIPPPEDQEQSRGPEPVHFAGAVVDFVYPVKNTSVGALKVTWTDTGKKARNEVFAVTNPNIVKALQGSKGEAVKFTAVFREEGKKKFWQLAALLQKGKYDFTDPESVQQYLADTAPKAEPAKQAKQAKQPLEPTPATSTRGAAPKIEQVEVELPPTGKAKKTTTAKWFELEGIVIANSGVREAANKAQVVTIGIDALPDYRANPKGQHNRFDCYHKSLHAALSNAKISSLITFRYFPETTSEGKVIQYIEDVCSVDGIRFREGKVVQDSVDDSPASPRGLFA